MPTFSPDTARRPLTIENQEFTVPVLFAAGHVLTEGEAASLNQTLRENVRNNLAARLKPGKDNAAPKGLSQADVDAYVTEYEFGARRGGGGGEAGFSPVERKARSIAREKVKEALAKRGQTLNLKTDEGKATMEKLVSQVAAKPEIVKEAEKQLKAVEKIALDDLDIAA
jgi:hypothetical protein